MMRRTQMMIQRMNYCYIDGLPRKRVIQIVVFAIGCIWVQVTSFLLSPDTKTSSFSMIKPQTLDAFNKIAIRHSWSCMQAKENLQAGSDDLSNSDNARQKPKNSPEFKVDYEDLSNKVYEQLMLKYDEQIPGPDPTALPARPLKINLDLLTHYARQSMLSGNTSEGLRLYQRCVDIDPRDGRAWLALGRWEGRHRRFEAAEKIFNKGLYFSPSNPYILQAYGVMEEKRGNKVKALELYSKATTADPDHVASWVARAKLLQRFGRVKEARIALQTATQADHDNYYAWQVWGILEKDEGNLDFAIELFEQSVEVNPNNAAAYQAWGILEQQMGNLDKARELFRKAVKENPRSTYTLQAWAVLEAKDGNHDEAFRLLDKALRKRPKDAAIHQTYALLLKKQGRFMSARQMFRAATKANPHHTPSWQAWGIMEAELGDIEAARDLFQQGAWGCPEGKNVVRIFQAWAILEADEGNLEESRKYFKYALEKAEQTSRGLIPILVAWALVEERGGSFVRARQLMELCVSYSDADPNLWQLYETMEVRNGNLLEARQIAEKRMMRGDKNFALSPLIQKETQLGLQSTSKEIEIAFQRFGRSSIGGSGVNWDDDFMSFKMS